MILFLMISFLFCIGFLILLTKPGKPPTFGIYQHENGYFYIKFALFYLLLTTRKFFNNRKRKLANADDEWSVSEEEHKFDGPQTLHDHPKAIDAVYFNTSSKTCENVLICGLARRPEGVCNAFLYFKVAGRNMMLSPKLPDTTLQQTSEEIGTHNVEGLCLKTIEPMKTWSLQYNGKMKDSTDFTKVFDVEVDATWTADFRPFNYDTDMSPSSMANDIARETWSEEYFKMLKEVHQTHFEQYGHLDGKVKINGTMHEIHTRGVRDHSFGKIREWKNFHRYGLHFLSLENGDYLSVGTVCMPICFSKLTIGFICLKSERKIYPIDFCDLELHRHGENSVPPLDYAFQFRAGGKLYTIQLEVLDSETFLIGHEHESRVVERLVKCNVNGVEGWGASEWYYRNMDKNILSKYKK